MKDLIAKWKAWWQDQWNKHGTKYLGSLTTFFGLVQTAVIAGTLELEKWERQVIAVIVIFLGSATVKRAVGSPPKIDTHDAPPK